MSRTAAQTSTIAKIDLNNTAPESLASVVNLQQFVNEAAEALGYTGSGDTNRNVYQLAPTPCVVANGDDRKVAIKKLDQKFRDTTLNGGHAHTAVDGDGAQISASDLADINYFKAQRQTFLVSPGSGASNDISTQMTGKTPGGNATTAGVPTSSPYNKVVILDASTLTNIEDAEGQRVYGRITESLGTWTLSYYTNEGGVETSHSLSSTNIRVFFLEVFDLANLPTFTEEDGFVGSLDLTADVLDASATQRGLITTGAQAFAGLKTFNDGLKALTEWTTPKSDVASAATINALSYSPFVRLTGTTATQLNGIGSGADGRRLVLYNGSTAVLTLSNENAGASASDRLKLPGGNDIEIDSFGSVAFVYDSGASRWVLQSSVGSGAGGGSGGSLKWTDGTSAPVISSEYDADHAFFSADGGQDLHTVIRVPATYTPGKPVAAHITLYSPDSSGNILMKTQSTLIQPGDAFSDATDQRTSTNTELTLSGGTVDEPQYIDFDLSDGSGLINGTAIAPGDLIKVRLYRDVGSESTSATSEARVQVFASEVTFR